jgi:cellulose synthase operon protein C
MNRIVMNRLMPAALALTMLVAGCGARTPEDFVASAKQQLAKNDVAAAIVHLRNALQKDPDLGEARFLLGKALLDAGEFVAAEKELRRAVELKFPADQAIPALARAMLSLGQTKKLVEEFGKTEIASPAGSADLQTTIGLALLAQGDLPAAKAAFAAAQTVQPEYPRAVLGEARAIASAGELKPALELVDRALAKAPGLSEGWQLKGALLAALEQPDAALVAYRKAIEIDRTDIAAHSAVVSMLMQQGKTEEAGKQLEALKQVAPKHPQTLYLQAWIAYTQKNFAAANEAIQEQLRLAPDNLPGLLLGGAIDLQLKSYAQAEAKLQKVVAAIPRHRFALRLLISLYAESGQPAKAMALLTPILPAIDQDAEMLALAGAVFMQHGDVDEGIAYFERAAALDPKSERNRTAVALAHLQKGVTDRALAELEEAAAADTGTHADMALIAAHLRQRQFDKALVAIDALEKKQPESPIPPNLRGGALLGKGDTAGARRSFERALTLDAKYFPAAASLARMDLADKKPDEAKKRFEAVVAKDPKNTQALLALAQLRAQTGGSADDVAALIGKAVAANPADESSRLALVNHYLRQKDTRKAVAAAQDALAALPGRPQVLDALGKAQRAAGDSNQALATYRKLAEAVPASPLPYLRMAEVHIAAKDKDKAMESLRQALTLKPDLVEAQRAIIALDLDAGRLPKAIAMARDIQKQRPKQSVGFILEGDIYASKKMWKESTAAYREGLKQAGSNDLAIKLDAVLRASGHVSEADKFATSWLKDHPRDGVFRLYMAESATRRKDYATSLEHYRVLLDARPDNPLLLNNVAWAMGQAGDPQALEYAEKAYALAPTIPTIADTLGMLLVEKGDMARGIELLQKASGAVPENASIRLHLAKALLKAGKNDAAKKELEVLAKLGDKYPGQAEVAQLLKGL